MSRQFDYNNRYYVLLSSTNIHNAVSRGGVGLGSFVMPVSCKRVFLKLHFVWDLFKLNQLCVVSGADFVSCVGYKLIAGCCRCHAMLLLLCGFTGQSSKEEEGRTHHAHS